jgi:hypothetical protein
MNALWRTNATAAEHGLSTKAVDVELKIPKLRQGLFFPAVDGMHFNIRLEEDRLRALVMVGERLDGTKELVAIRDGYRESERIVGGSAPRPETARNARPDPPGRRRQHSGSGRRPTGLRVSVRVGSEWWR